MPVYTGVLKSMGSGGGTDKEVRRSFIDIGDHHLVNVVSSRYIDDYLQQAATQGGETRIGVWSWRPYGTQVVAIRLPNGQRRSVDEDPSAARGYRSQMIMLGLIAGVGGSIFLGLMFGNLGVLLSLAAMVLYPFLGLKSLRESKQAV